MVDGHQSLEKVVSLWGLQTPVMGQKEQGLETHVGSMGCFSVGSADPGHGQETANLRKTSGLAGDAFL
jgi:hypothetical protein